MIRKNVYNLGVDFSAIFVFMSVKMYALSQYTSYDLTHSIVMNNITDILVVKSERLHITKTKTKPRVSFF
jgi:hypothetical protein